MSQKPLPWLLAYDVRDPRRLKRIHAWMLRWAAPVQYSVFLGNFRERHLVALLDEVNSSILAPEDDLRAYPVATRHSVVLVGTPRCPEDWEGLTRLLHSGGIHAEPADRAPGKTRKGSRKPL